MTRVLVGTVAATIVAMMPAVGSAGPAQDPRVSVTRGGGHVTISARTESLSVTQTLTAAGFDLRVVDGLDTVRITGDAAGHVRVERSGQSMALVMTSAEPADMARVQTLLADSTALAAFDRLMTTDWSRGRNTAAVFVPAHAIVALLRGHTGPTAGAVRVARSHQGPAFTTVAQGPSGCWQTYERDVVRYTYDLEACIRDASDSWNPLATAWCAYEFNLKASLAFIWLLDCHGISG
jgi:hypothetical protein